MNRSLKIIMNVLNICLVFCYICIILYVFVAAPSLFGYTPQIVLSPSMEPGYKVGSVIYYDDSVPFESIEMFDVITFKLGRNDTATHRVVGVNMTQGKQILLTKGDNNENPDTDYVHKDEYLGKVINYRLPFVGYFISFINNNIYISVVAVVLIVAKIVINIITDKDEEDSSSKKEEVSEEDSDCLQGDS